MTASQTLIHIWCPNWKTRNLGKILYKIWISTSSSLLFLSFSRSLFLSVFLPLLPSLLSFYFWRSRSTWIKECCSKCKCKFLSHDDHNIFQWKLVQFLFQWQPESVPELISHRSPGMTFFCLMSRILQFTELPLHKTIPTNISVMTYELDHGSLRRLQKGLQ